MVSSGVLLVNGHQPQGSDTRSAAGGTWWAGSPRIHMAPTWKMSLQGPLKKLMDDRSGDIRDYQSDAPLVFRSFPVPQVP